MPNTAKNNSIGQLCEVIRGTSFRLGLSKQIDGDFAVVSPTDISEFGAIKWAQLYKIHLSKIDERLVLKEGDILFPTKGKNIRPTVISLEQKPKNLLKIVPSDLFFIVRIKDSRLTISYLDWYLKQSSARRFIQSNAAQGSQVLMITQKGFSELKIPLPSLEKQKQIVELANLAAKEEELSHKIFLNKRKVVNQLLMSSIEN